MDETTLMYVDYIETPVGRLAIVVDEKESLRAVGFTEGHPRMDRLVGADGKAGGSRGAGAQRRLVPKKNPAGLTAPIRAYFCGELAAIEGLPVTLVGTDFQRTVWTALLGIPCGETWSYGQLAARIGKPKAMRAVGLANGANPVGIVVPCHRVIGADGSLTGYGGGMQRKRWLLEHERAARVDSQLRFA
jgi:methylated-DNA-[protein]-cysteine S-methyltransferase